MCQVVATFQRMRQEQRSMASKAAELEMEINEHRSVADIHTSPLKSNASYFHNRSTVCHLPHSYSAVYNSLHYY